jgi:hypothetical protein
MNQVEQRHTEAAESLCVSDDHPQVRLHETAERHLITMLLHTMTELLLIVARQ